MFLVQIRLWHHTWSYLSVIVPVIHANQLFGGGGVLHEYALMLSIGKSWNILLRIKRSLWILSIPLITLTFLSLTHICLLTCFWTINYSFSHVFCVTRPRILMRFQSRNILFLNSIFFFFLNAEHLCLNSINFFLYFEGKIVETYSIQ